MAVYTNPFVELPVLPLLTSLSCRTSSDLLSSKGQLCHCEVNQKLSLIKTRAQKTDKTLALAQT